MAEVKTLRGSRVNLLWAVLLLALSASFFIYIVATSSSPVLSGVIALVALVFLPTALIERRILAGVFHSLEADETSLARSRLGARRVFRWEDLREFSIYFEIADGRNIATGGITAILGLFLFSAYIDTGRMTYHIATSEDVVEDGISFVGEKRLREFMEELRALGQEVQESELPRAKGFRRMQFTVRINA